MRQRVGAEIEVSSAQRKRQREEEANSLSIEVSPSSRYTIFLVPCEFRPYSTIKDAFDVVECAMSAVEGAGLKRGARGDDEPLDVVQVGVSDSEASERV